MKTENGIPMNNPAVAALPKHLLQFAVDQRYDDYTPVDHAVWRFIMRQNIFFLKEYAHKVYFQGLLDTGISFERIPRIERNERHPRQDRLGRGGGGWLYSAGGVHGIPSLQGARDRLRHAPDCITSNTRPAPDIVHEAAGHAPIIVDREYSDYLQRFGEVGAKAMSSKKDFELYEAIRHLSILKELPDSDPKQVEEATRQVEEGQKNLGDPSEMALLSRLHWWTVEYGLIGTLENPKIYGAGLLSSIGESVSCLEPHVKKIAVFDRGGEDGFRHHDETAAALRLPRFPALWRCARRVCRAGWRLRVGGLEGINKAIACKNTATCEYSSGLPGLGHVHRSADRFRKPADLSANSRSERARLPETRNCPGTAAIITRTASVRRLGRWKETEIREGQTARLEFESGVTVEGRVEKILRRDGKMLLITFSNCTAKLGDRVLFDPAWGTYDMAVGERHQLGLQRRGR